MSGPPAAVRRRTHLVKRTVISGTFPRQAAITSQMRGAARTATEDLADSDLMRKTAEGDRDAFAALYRRHHAMVYRFARLMTGSTSAAEDIVQEVFLVLMRDASRYEPERAALASYLYGVARHQTRRRLARDRQFVAFDADTADATRDLTGDLAATIERRHALQRLRRAILSLPRKYREVIVLCDLQDLSYGDAGVALGCAVGTIRSRLHRARLLLTQKMKRAALREREDQRLTMRCAI
jgi:RNA polymerase sigma-70 factor (ECF subfamily)